MKRILFCTNVPLIKELGAAKVLVELAEEMRKIDWVCDMISPSDFPISDTGSRNAVEAQFHRHLHTYLLQHASDYDVVDYDHEHLPFLRSDFSTRSLFVARSVLLVHHLSTIAIPTRSGVRGTLGRFLKGPARRRRTLDRIDRAQKIVQEADLVNVSNNEDRAELQRRGIDAGKIVVIPYGISEQRRLAFDRVSSAIPEVPTVAFVGTFDYRKGAKEFPRIVRLIANKIPNVRFRLLGTRGMFRTREEVLAHFAKDMVDRIDVVPYFDANNLPDLLAPCTVGMFPSHVEGFGFGVLEMMASAVPVVAYNVPGPPMMLDDCDLVKPGDAESMAARIVGLLSDSKRLQERRIWSQERSRTFTWSRSAEITDEIYSREMAKRR